MTLEELKRNLKYEMNKHKNDKVDTCDTNISAMCRDTLEVLETMEKEIRVKTIDDVISVIVDEIEREMGCKLCSDYEEKGKCTTCQINKMIARVIDRLEQLKEVE